MLTMTFASMITGNSASQDGGGIFSNGDSLVIIVGIIRQNSTKLGGGIAYHGAAPTLVASSVTGNAGGDMVTV